MKQWLFIWLFLYGGQLLAGHIRVGKNRPYRGITEAITAAKPGDTVIVDQGTYFEKNLVIRKPIVLTGLGHPLLDGEGKYEIISVKSSHVTINGFRFQHTGVSSMEDYAAIKIYNSSNVKVTNNIIRDAFFGIYAQYGINCLIQNNYLAANNKEEQQSGNGIHCWKSDSMRIIGNTITGHRDGIYFEFVTNSLIWKNSSNRNLRYGLHFMFSNDDAYMSNVFADNGAGVAVMFSKGVKMVGNMFRENWGDAAYGLLLKEINDSHIENNRFEKNSIAVYAEGANRVKVTRNLFKSNGWAFRIQASCSDINLQYNNFTGNTFDIATNGSLVLNSFNRNYWDKYEGYDLNKDGIGDISFRPVSMYAMIIEQNPSAVMMFRSFMATLLDKTEKVLPSLTPEDLKDDSPLMKPWAQ